MERYSDRAIEIINELHMERLDYESEYLPLIDCANQCASYEDTGLTPEEIERILDAYGRGRTLRTEIGERLEIVHGIPTDRLRELVKARNEGRVVALEDITVHQANTIMGMCERLNAMKSRRGDDQEPLITWQLYNALLKSIIRAEGESAIGGGGDG